MFFRLGVICGKRKINVVQRPGPELLVLQLTWRHLFPKAQAPLYLNTSFLFQAFSLWYEKIILRVRSKITCVSTFFSKLQ